MILTIAIILSIPVGFYIGYKIEGGKGFYIKFKNFYCHKQKSFLTIRFFQIGFKFYKKNDSWIYRGIIWLTNATK